jgi:outer membrane cobalamin receptor
MVKKHAAAAALSMSLIFLANAVTAEETTTQLNEVVVTATKTEKEPQDITQSVTVITANDIQKSGATTAAEAIERTVGTDVKDYGSTGSLSSINLRGANAEQVLILLDGKRLNSASAGGYDMSDLSIPLENIDRIEIVRGPSSALYGADAVGGVVNIITKKPSALSTTVTGEGGSHGYESYSLSTSNKIDKFYYNLYGGKEWYDGFRTNSDLNQSTAGAKLGYDITPDSSLEFNTDWIGKEIGVPGPIEFPSPLARQWDRNVISSLTYRTKFSKELDLRLNAFQNRENISYTNPDPLFPVSSKHTSTTSDGEAQTNWLANSWNLLTFGFEARQDHVESTDAGEHTDSLWAVYLQDEISVGEPLIIVIGGRNDSHSVYGDKFSPKASARYLISGPGTIIRASVGEAFRAPTLNELYWSFDGFEQGNPNLKPETSTEYDAGIEQPLGKGNFIKFTYFERKVSDLIQWLPNSSFIYSPVNIGKAQITGSETEAVFVPFKPVTWAINYTYMRAVDETTGLYLYNIPKEQLKSYLNWTLPTKTNLYIEGRYIKNYAQPTLPNPTLNYTVVDAKVLQPVKLGQKITCDVFFGIKNMFNRQYQAVAGYPMPPEELYGGASVRF